MTISLLVNIGYVQSGQRTEKVRHPNPPDGQVGMEVA